jgi:hypothetical protein
MTAEEQKRDIGIGLQELEELFPEKLVRYFIAPFNRTNRETYAVCKEFGLKVLAAEGIHLEEQLGTLYIQPGVWHRYHHHRFYPESAFDYHKLSMESLEFALRRNYRSEPGEM